MQPSARNFNPEADKDCCCQYFQLQLELEHSSDTAGNSLNLNSPYLDDFGTAYIPTDLQLLISRPRLVDNLGQEHGIQDSAIYTLWDNSRMALWNGPAVLNPNNRTVQLGRFDRAGRYERLRFELGLPTAWEQVNNSLLPSGHPLRNAALYSDSLRRYYSHSLSLILPNIQDTFTLILQENNLIDLPIDLLVEDGRNASIGLRIGYLDLFSGVDFARDDRASIRQKIRDNTPNIFRIN